VGGIYETKWFGADLYPAADGCILLHSWRPVSCNVDEMMRVQPGGKI